MWALILWYDHYHCSKIWSSEIISSKRIKHLKIKNFKIKGAHDCLFAAFDTDGYPKGYKCPVEARMTKNRPIEGWPLYNALVLCLGLREQLELAKVDLCQSTQALLQEKKQSNSNNAEFRISPSKSNDTEILKQRKCLKSNNGNTEDATIVSNAEHKESAVCEHKYEELLSEVHALRTQMTEIQDTLRNVEKQNEIILQNQMLILNALKIKDKIDAQDGEVSCATKTTSSRCGADLIPPN